MSLDGERRKQIESICDAALQRSVADRAAFVAAACASDPALLREVESLLGYASVPFLEGPVAALAAGMIDAAALRPGDRIGVYVVAAPIGAGGMGEVYRARDTRLGRDVAIKLLPAAFTADADRRIRLEREARVLAALNHPHIGAIYGVEDIGGSTALILELVDGETLAERLAHGALPARGAIDVARQIAEALEAAHAIGIVHRDLKPANIKIASSGAVKVLDFGLARLDDARASDRSQSPTITSSGAREGLLRGTPGYMSPEQARGQSADKRTDIWAFGCVLYEMLSRCPVIAGDTVADRLAAILEREPDWTRLPPATPAALERLLRRCLEKDPKRRLHDIADARIELEDLLASASVPVSTPARRTSGIQKGLAAAAALLVLVAAIATARYTTWLPRPSLSSGGVSRHAVTRFAVTAPADAPIISAFALSPDGSALVYAAKESMGTLPRLFLRRLDRLDADALAGDQGGIAPFFSPDGQWVGFFDRVGTLKKISATTGSAAIAVCECHERNVLSATWTRDNAIIFASVDHPLRRVSAGGGEPQPVTTIDHARHERDHHNPQMLPDGRTLLYTIHETGERGDVFRVAVQSLVTGERRVLVEQGFDARVAPAGQLVYASGQSLLAVPFDGTRVAVTGAPVRVADDVATVPESGIGNFAVSETGTLVYLQQARKPASRTVILADRAGAETPLPLDPRAYLICRLSPDGRHVVLTIASDTSGSQNDIWVYDIGADRPRRVTFGGDNVSPLWTPDGRRIIYTSMHPGRSELIALAADGRSGSETLVSGADPMYAAGWTANGRELLYVDQPAAGPNHIMRLMLGEKPQPLPLNDGRPPFSHVLSPTASPDGHWLAFVGVEAGRAGEGEIFVDSLDKPGERHQVTTDGGSHPLWRGREILFRKGDAIFAIAVQTTPAFVAGGPELLFRGPYRRGAPGVPDYDVGSDGRFLLVKPGREEIAPRNLSVVLNWADEVIRK